MNADMHINHKYGPSGEPSGAEPCRKLRKPLKQTGIEITATRKPQKILHAFTHTETLTLLLHIIKS